MCVCLIKQPDWSVGGKQNHLVTWQVVTTYYLLPLRPQVFFLRAQVSLHVVTCGGHYLELDFCVVLQ